MRNVIAIVRGVIGMMIGSFILFSCSAGEDKVKKMTCISSASELSDTLFFADVENLMAVGEDILFIDMYRNRIVCMDVSDWSVKSLIGVPGEGPDELCALFQFACRDSILYALDVGCGKVMAYDLQGNISAKYPLPLESSLMSGYRFLVSEGREVNISTRSDMGAFVNWNLWEEGLSFWGERFRFDADQAKIRNGRHLLETADGYIAVSDNMPQIEKYDSQKNKAEVYDFSNIPVVKKRLLKLEGMAWGAKSYGIVCEDACVHQDKLYLLLASDDDKGFAVNQIAVFSLFPRIEYDGVLELPGRIYSTFCVSHNQIIAFESLKNCFEVFLL